LNKYIFVEVTTMKKSRKLLALVLAMMMAFSMSTASAAYEEEHVHDETCCEATVQPRNQVIWCPRCGASARVWTVGNTEFFDCSGCGSWDRPLH
jgi:hypothetical protein